METTQVDGIYYSDEKAAAIAASFSYDSFQIVRREMFAHLFRLLRSGRIASPLILPVSMGLRMLFIFRSW